MKKENIGYGIMAFILLGASFYAGRLSAPETQDYNEKVSRIHQLEEVIIEQQLMYTSTIKHMPQFKIKNWAMNKQ